MIHRARACRISRLLAASAVAFAVATAAAPGALAAPIASAAASASATGWLRLANLSPGAPTFDIYLYPVGNMHARLVLRNISYGMVSRYQPVPAGGYTVAMRRAGQPASSPPQLSATISVAAGQANTMTSVGPSSAPRLELLRDMLSTPKGQALVRIIQASLSQTRVTVTAGGHALVRGLSFGSATSYATVPPGRWDLSVSGETMHAAGRETWAAGSSYTLVVLDAPGRLVLDCLTDGAGSRAQPAGGAEMGFGGTAPHPGPAHPGPALPWLAGMAGGAVMAAGGALWLRRTR